MKKLLVILLVVLTLLLTGCGERECELCGYQRKCSKVVVTLLGFEKDMYVCKDCKRE